MSYDCVATEYSGAVRAFSYCSLERVSSCENRVWCYILATEFKQLSQI